MGPHVGRSVQYFFFFKLKFWVSSSSGSDSSSRNSSSSSRTIFGRMCAAMSPKEQNISKPVAASMAFAIFLKEIVIVEVYLGIGIKLYF